MNEIFSICEEHWIIGWFRILQVWIFIRKYLEIAARIQDLQNRCSEKFRKKHLLWSASHFINKMTLSLIFSSKFFKISKNNYFKTFPGKYSLRVLSKRAIPDSTELKSNFMYVYIISQTLLWASYERSILLVSPLECNLNISFVESQIHSFNHITIDVLVCSNSPDKIQMVPCVHFQDANNIW